MSEPGTTPSSNEPAPNDAMSSTEAAGIGPRSDAAPHMASYGQIGPHQQPMGYPPGPPQFHYPPPGAPPAMASYGYGYPQWQMVQQPVRQLQMDGFPLWIPALPKIPSGPGIGGMIAAIVGIPLGIIALVLSFVAPMAALVLLVPALFFGAGGGVALSLVSLRRIKNHPGRYSGRGVAMAGFVMGLIATSFTGLAMLISPINL